MVIESNMVGIEVTVLTPFYYHSVPIAGGSATLAQCISDTAFNFALASALGMMEGVCLPIEADHRHHIGAMPFRSSVLISDNATLLPAQVRRLNLDAEAGYNSKISAGSSKGNLKDFYRIQEVNVGAVYHGVIFGADPFALSGQPELIVRVGKHRQGMIRVKPVSLPETVVLNAYTASVFDREISLSEYLLHTIQLSMPMTPQEALAEVSAWH
ncbi:hypothetical protein [Photobacterium leiognathi]|uniref:hypothetical protein n=1 Tax=Photobacterium leiognathi TaxID=553611 RepID=UPI00298246C7|nr:hypothetical protein [Photobacterium leiognathi]